MNPCTGLATVHADVFRDDWTNMVVLQVPEEARELEKELRQITKEKNEAVRSQDFEKV